MQAPRSDCIFYVQHPRTLSRPFSSVLRAPLTAAPQLGFGVTAKSTQECRKLDPTAICVFHQADVGEYLRDEDTAQAIG